jgi:hypothetical protein
LILGDAERTVTISRGGIPDEETGARRYAADNRRFDCRSDGVFEIDRLYLVERTEIRLTMKNKIGVIEDNFKIGAWEGVKKAKEVGRRAFSFLRGGSWIPMYSEQPNSRS